MLNTNNNAILHFFTLMAFLFLFRGSFPMEDMWGFPISLIFCALAYAAGMVGIAEKDGLKALMPRLDVLMYSLIYPAYVLMMILNMGDDHGVAKTKIISFIVSSLPAYYLGWMLGQDQRWPERVLKTLLAVLAAVALWHIVQIIRGAELLLLFQAGTYQNLGMLVAFSFIATVLMQNTVMWPIAVAVSASWYISAFLAVLSFLFFWIRVRAKQAFLLYAVLAASTLAFAYGGTGSILKLTDKISFAITAMEGKPSSAEYDRLMLFYEGIVGFLHNPVIGQGTASFYYNGSSYPHNVFIEHMYEHGVLGLLIVLGVLWYPLKKILFNLNGGVHARMIGAFFLATFVFSFFGGQTFSRLMLFVIGLAVALPPANKGMVDILLDLWRKKPPSQS